MTWHDVLLWQVWNLTVMESCTRNQSVCELSDWKISSLKWPAVCSPLPHTYWFRCIIWQLEFSLVRERELKSYSYGKLPKERHSDSSANCKESSLKWPLCVRWGLNLYFSRALVDAAFADDRLRFVASGTHEWHGVSCRQERILTVHRHFFTGFWGCAIQASSDNVERRFCRQIFASISTYSMPRRNCVYSLDNK